MLVYTDISAKIQGDIHSKSGSNYKEIDLNENSDEENLKSAVNEINSKSSSTLNKNPRMEFDQKVVKKNKKKGPKSGKMKNKYNKKKKDKYHTHNRNNENESYHS